MNLFFAIAQWHMNISLARSLPLFLSPRSICIHKYEETMTLCSFLCEFIAFCLIVAVFLTSRSMNKRFFHECYCKISKEKKTHHLSFAMLVTHFYWVCTWNCCTIFSLAVLIFNLSTFEVSEKNFRKTILLIGTHRENPIKLSVRLECSQSTTTAYPMAINVLQKCRQQKEKIHHKTWVATSHCHDRCDCIWMMTGPEINLNWIFFHSIPIEWLTLIW